MNGKEKPKIRPEYVKGQIVKSKEHLYESLQRPNGTYFWHQLPDADAIDEGGVSVYASDTNIGRALRRLLDSMLENPNYRFSDIDYDSFHEYRARFPLCWNEFLSLYRSRMKKSTI